MLSPLPPRARKAPFGGLTWTHFCLAALAVAAATGVSHVEPFRARPFPIYFCGVFLVAWSGGMVAGLATTIGSSFALSYFFLEPVGSLRVGNWMDVFRLASFCLSAFFVSAYFRHKGQERDTGVLTESRLRDVLDDAQRFQAALEVLIAERPDLAALILDERGCILSCGKTAEQMTGFSPNKLLGQHLTTLFPSSLIPHGRPLTQLQEAATQGRSKHEENLLRPDGTPWRATLNLTALKSDGNPGTDLIGFLATLERIA